MIPIDPSKLRLMYFPSPVLKRRAMDVTDFGPGLGALTRRMLAVMREGNGVGLAGPQVGVPARVFVCNVTGEPDGDLVFVNPTFVELSGAEEKEEGCLSIPGVHVTMRRAVRATIAACDVYGKSFMLGATGLLARAWQHEVDHLDGRLIIDNMSPTDEIANRRILRQLRKDYAGPE